jgi:hypothetical protein
MTARPSTTQTTASTTKSGQQRDRRPQYRPGDLVTTATGYPVLYEILAVDPAGLVRVRGVNWAPGYSAAVSPDEIRPVTGILSSLKP